MEDKRDVWKNTLSCFLLTGIAVAQGNPLPSKNGTTIYIVEPGDPLWKVLQQPPFCPKLWEINPCIDNPNRIYTGDVIALKPEQPGIPVVKVEPNSHKVLYEDIKPPPVYYYTRVGPRGL